MYIFTEKILGPNFRQDILVQVKSIIKAGSSCMIIGMPFVGISGFLRFLTTTELAYFIYLDVNALSHSTKDSLFYALYKQLGGKKSSIKIDDILEACKERLSIVLKTEDKIVIVIAYFDNLELDYSDHFLNKLKALEDLAKSKIIFIVSAHKPLYGYENKIFSQEYISIFSKIIYFSPYSEKDMRKILLLSPVSLKSNPSEINNIKNISGGNATLLQLLLKTEHLQNPIQDGFIRTYLKTIYDSCSNFQKKILQKIAFGKNVSTMDSYLLKIGLVKEVNFHYELFSSLFLKYILLFTHMKLAPNERKLFILFKKHLGRTINKNAIFKLIWEKDSEIATDWALNSLIYRLRRNQTFINQGYIIENDKKIGYRMIKGG